MMYKHAYQMIIGRHELHVLVHVGGESKEVILRNSRLYSTPWICVVDSYIDESYDL